MVLLTSRQGLFSATPASSGGQHFHQRGHSFSRSYGVKLPSSLTRVLPIALGFSPHLPVSVCGTGTRDSSLRGFSWRMGLTTSGSCGIRLAPRAPSADLPTLLIALQTLHLHVHQQAGLPFRVPPSLLSGGTGILTRCPSPTPFGLGLGPD